VEYANGKEDVNNNEGGCVCIVKDKDEQKWEKHQMDQFTTLLC
jgi:hypothetical protein